MGRNYIKLLILANKLPTLRKTVKHYTENSPVFFSKFKSISVTEMVTVGAKEKRKTPECSAKPGASKALQGNSRMVPWSP